MRRTVHKATVYIIVSDATFAPPYRIENRSSSATLLFRQEGTKQWMSLVRRPLRFLPPPTNCLSFEALSGALSLACCPLPSWITLVRFVFFPSFLLPSFPLFFHFFFYSEHHTNLVVP